MSKGPIYFCDGCGEPHEYGKHTVVSGLVSEDLGSTTDVSNPPPPTPTLRESITNHPKAIISTDDNYPTILQIPLDDLLALLSDRIREAIDNLSLPKLDYLRAEREKKLSALQEKRNDG